MSLLTYLHMGFMDCINEDDFFISLETVLEKALEQGQYSVALKALELIGRVRGFVPEKKSKCKAPFSIDSLNNDELEKIIESAYKFVD